ncbi:MAG: hypothetical protein ACXW5W_23495, partial [Candidatus Binatia bacterium]
MLAIVPKWPKLQNYYYRAATRRLHGLMSHAKNLLVLEDGMNFQQLADKALQGILPEREELR